MSKAGPFDHVFKETKDRGRVEEQKEEAPDEESDTEKIVFEQDSNNSSQVEQQNKDEPTDFNNKPVLIPPSPSSPSPSIPLQPPHSNQKQQPQQHPVQSPIATTNMSNSFGSKIPNLCPNMLIFFKNANLGHRDTDPVPLVCQEKGYFNILHFGLLLDPEIKTGFKDYNTNGNGTGTQTPVMLGIQNQIEPLIVCCRFFLQTKVILRP